METQAAISRAKLKSKVGKTLKVLIDEPGVGRSSGDAPEIDGTVKFRGGAAGEFAEVRIQSSTEHDLRGEIVSS